MSHIPVAYFFTFFTLLSVCNIRPAEQGIELTDLAKLRKRTEKLETSMIQVLDTTVLHGKWMSIHDGALMHYIQLNSRVNQLENAVANLTDVVSNNADMGNNNIDTTLDQIDQLKQTIQTLCKQPTPKRQ